MEPSESTEAEAALSLLALHRDIGRLEGRVQALEGDTREIKASLRSIYGRINEIWNLVSSTSGEKTGERNARRALIGMVGWGVNAGIATVTAWIMVRYGK